MSDEIKEAIKFFGREDLLNDYGIQDTDTNIEVFLSVKDMIKYYKQGNEIERLNNIINELEKHLKDKIERSWEIEEQCYENIYCTLQDLKDSDKE